jgi:hypothetical protein
MNERRFNPQSLSLRAQFLYSYSALTLSNAADTAVGKYFTLSQVGSYAEYCNLFDQYRILEIEIWIEPTMTMATAAASESAFYITCPDLDDAGTPTVNSMQLKPGAIQSGIFHSHYHRFQPRTATPSYQASAFTGYSVGEPGIWLNTTYPDIQHYGLKIGASISQTNAIVLRATVRFTVEFRGID